MGYLFLIGVFHQQQACIKRKNMQEKWIHEQDAATGRHALVMSVSKKKKFITTREEIRPCRNVLTIHP